MAFASGRAGTAENTLGYDNCISAMYIFEQCRGLPTVSQKRAVKPGTLRKGIGSKILLPPIFERRLSQNCRGKSSIKHGVPDAAA